MSDYGQIIVKLPIKMVPMAEITNFVMGWPSDRK
jgi:hypothetical protein